MTGMGINDVTAGTLFKGGMGGGGNVKCPDAGQPVGLGNDRGWGFVASAFLIRWDINTKRVFHAYRLWGVYEGLSGGFCRTNGGKLIKGYCDAGEYCVEGYGMAVLYELLHALVWCADLNLNDSGVGMVP